MVQASNPKRAIAGGAGGGTVPSQVLEAGLVFEKPSLERAKSFGRECRPHRIPDPSHASGYRLAKIGEAFDAISRAKAEPYTFFGTSLSCFDDFGIGVSLYFRQLVFLAVLFFFSGLIYIPSIYNNWRSNPPDTMATLKGSAYGAERDDLKFGLTGMTDFAVCIFLLIFATVSQRVEDAVATHVDLAQQTPQDYAVCVQNPDPNNRDADSYQRFFSKFGEVVTVSIALDNGDLLRALAKKREVELEMSATIEGQSLLSAGVDSHVEDSKAIHCYHHLLHMLGLKRCVHFLQHRRRRLLKQIERLSLRQSRVKRVFIIFNTEKAQRACLHRMSTGLIHRWFSADRSQHEDHCPEGVFEGRRLRVCEPVEPSEVNWENFNLTKLFRLWRMFVSYAITAGVLYVSYLLLMAVRHGRGIWSGLIVSGVNVLLPLIVKLLTTNIEVHLDQSDSQDSIMTKLVVARCLNTAVMKFLVTDYESAFAQDSLNSIMYILIADTITTPLLNLVNVVQRFRQCFLAPRAKTQQEMEMYFVGSSFSLAERYTDVIKTIFVGLFYSSVMPVLPFITSITCIVIFWTDKYNLLFQWRRPPAIDGTLAGRSRNFLSVSVAVHIIMARVFFANWPYSDKVEKPRCGFLVCLPRSFFTPDQLHLVNFYNIFGFITLGLVCWTSLYQLVFSGFGRFLGWVSEVGDATDIEYRSLVATEAYVPLIRSQRFSNPLLACDVSKVPPTFLPIHEQLSVSRVDVERLSLCSSWDLPFIPTREERAKLFGSVTYYPPTGAAVPQISTPISPSVQSPQASEPLPIPVIQSMLHLATDLLQPTQLTENINPTAVVPLPPDWQEMADEDGKVYYFNTVSGASQWDRPVAGAGPGLMPQPGQFTGLQHDAAASPFRPVPSRRTPPPFQFALD